MNWKNYAGLGHWHSLPNCPFLSSIWGVVFCLCSYSFFLFFQQQIHLIHKHTGIHTCTHITGIMIVEHAASPLSSCQLKFKARLTPHHFTFHIPHHITCFTSHHLFHNTSPVSQHITCVSYHITCFTSHCLYHITSPVFHNTSPVSHHITRVSHHITCFTSHHLFHITSPVSHKIPHSTSHCLYQSHHLCITSHHLFHITLQIIHKPHQPMNFTVIHNTRVLKP
jgi:hypothetical protein